MSTEQASKPEDDLRRYAKQNVDWLEEIAELQKQVKDLKDKLKAEGYDLKAFNQIVKELRRGSDYQAAQLELELIVDTYRRAAGLPVTLEAAQEAARQDAEQLPDRDDEGEDGGSLNHRIDRGFDKLAEEGKVEKIGPRTYRMPAKDGVETSIEVLP
jgi:uncharacterized protein (UPF0335 family)